MSVREKIMQEAQKMFLTKGYESTSVQMIIDQVGIAKGTFYYHFASKEALLEEILTDLVEMQSSGIRAQLQESDADALTKFRMFMDMQAQWKSKQYDVLFLTLKVLFSSDNYLYTRKLKEKTNEYFRPIMEDIVNQGVYEGVFHTPYPDQMSGMVIQLSNLLSESVMEFFIHHKDYEDPSEESFKKVEFLMHCIERLLGMEDHQLPLPEKDIFDDFINYLKENDY